MRKKVKAEHFFSHSLHKQVLNLHYLQSWFGGWAEKVKGVRSTNWLLQNGHGSVKYSIGNIVNNNVIIVCGIRWVRDLSG